jgi:DNA-directed RNA polymerase specialized sigma24 family protein
MLRSTIEKIANHCARYCPPVVCSEQEDTDDACKDCWIRWLKSFEPVTADAAPSEQEVQP